MRLRQDISGWQVRHDAAQAAAWRAAGLWRNRTIADDARELAARQPDSIALWDDRRSLTYAALLAESEALARNLAALGLAPGQVVSFQLPNCCEAAVINLAACLLGLVVNPIVPIYRDSEVGMILRDCRARVLFIPATLRGFDHVAMLARLRPGLPDLAHVVVLRGTAPGLLDYDTLLNPTAPACVFPAQDPGAVKFVLYTSGTTGRAKGVLHSHETATRALMGCMQYWRIGAGDIILMPSPVTHVTGYLWGLEATLCCATPTILMERWDAAHALRLIESHGVAMTVGATPFLQELLDVAAQQSTRLASLKIFACGGAAVPAALIRRANASFARARAFRVYGATEALMIGRGAMGPDELDLAAETDGRIMDFDIRLVDLAGRDVPDGQEGEILARGPAQCLGYADPQETAASLTPEGYFRTGDLGWRTPHGAIVISGRKKDLIIRGGENISAKEIEDLLLLHPAIRDVAVVAMPHPRLGETACAFVVPQQTPPTLADITAHLEQCRLARQKFPEHLEIITEFPRTPAGKVKKDLLRLAVSGVVVGGGRK